MPVLTIGDKSVTVGDDFLKLSKEDQDATVNDIAKSIGAGAKADPVTANQVLGAAAEGVPLIGGVRNQVNAAVNATLAPIVEPFLTPSKDDISRDGAGFGQRYSRSKAILEAQNKKFETEHPYIDTAAKIAGGVAGTIPAMAAAPVAFGLTGTLPQMVARGAASNALLGGADAAIRGESPAMAAAIGGGAGAVLPLAARGVGKLAQGIREYRNPTPPVAQNVQEVAGVKIPLTQGQATADPALQAQEEIARRGASGTSAEAIAKQADEEAKAAIGQASSNIGASLDPRSLPKPVSPAPAGIPDEVMAAAHADFPQIGGDPAAFSKAVQAIEAKYGPQAAQAYTDEIAAVAQHEAGRGGATVRTPPQSAADTVSNELMVQQQATAAAEAQRAAQVTGEGESLARGLGGGAAPVSSFDAAETAGAAVTRARDAKVAATREAYKARDAVPGTFDESVPRGMAEDIRTRLNSGEDPLWVDPTNESTANKALKLIDETIGKDTGVFANAAAPKVAGPASREAVPMAAAKQTEDDTVAALRAKFGDSVADAYVKQNRPAAQSAFPGDTPAVSAAGTAAPRSIDLKAMDNARKRLVTMFSDAKSKAMSSGDKSDMRAMGKILNEFDNVIGDSLAAGKFSGDAALAKELQDAARKSHSEYRQTFSSRGPGDEVGRAVEKILGRYSDTAATPDQIAKMAYGTSSNPGGGQAKKVAARLRDIMGENSPEWGQYKQGLFAHVTQAGEGAKPFAPEEVASRIKKFVSGGSGKVLADEVLSGPEKAQWLRYAKNLDDHAAAMNSSKVNLPKEIARITGADGHPPATIGEITDMMFSRSGKGNSGTSERLAMYLKAGPNKLSPEGWTAVRQAGWEKLATPIDGQVPYSPTVLSKRIDQFMDTGVSKVLYTAEERAEMKKLSALLKKFVPEEGVKNNSGSAWVGQRLLKKTGQNVLGLLGFATHGPVGAIVGHGLDVAGRTVKESRAAKDAQVLFYGKQPKGAPPLTSISPGAAALTIAGPTSQR
jgi:hypothetical protein